MDCKPGLATVWIAAIVVAIGCLVIVGPVIGVAVWYYECCSSSHFSFPERAKYGALEGGEADSFELRKKRFRKSRISHK